MVSRPWERLAFNGGGGEWPRLWAQSFQREHEWTNLQCAELGVPIPESPGLDLGDLLAGELSLPWNNSAFPACGTRDESLLVCAFTRCSRFPDIALSG